MTADTSLFAQAQAWLDEDWARMEKTLGPRLEAFRGKHILVTGAAGFLGFGFLHFFSYLNRNLLKTGPSVHCRRRQLHPGLPTLAD
jgi:UDP-glucuronate decarboxylase